MVKKLIQKVQNGNGTLKKTLIVISIIGAFFTFYWQAGDRIDNERGKAIAAVEIRIMAEVDKADVKLIGMIDKQQRKYDIRHWSQERDRARIELRRIRRGLTHHPNDELLLEEKEYWQEMYNRANRELDKLLNN